jgi:hypothetical protein
MHRSIGLRRCPRQDAHGARLSGVPLEWGYNAAPMDETFSRRASTLRDSRQAVRRA